MAQEQDFISFYQQEAKFREEMGYPPFARLINFRLEGNAEPKTLRYAKMMEQIVCRILQQNKKFQGQVEVLGPTPAPLARLKGKCRFQMLLKGKKWSILHHLTEQVLEKAEEVSIPGVKLIIDVDPVNML
jgi:primosomal protein N' (replication factor Y)